MTDEPETKLAETGQELAIPKKAELLANDEHYIMPTNVEEALRMARIIVSGGWAPASYNNDPTKVMLGLMAAMEAGLPPLYGLRQIAIINNRPTAWGDACMALVQSKNLIASITEEEIGTKPNTSDLTKWPDDYGYRVTIVRRGQGGQYIGEFTVGMAKMAQLWLNAKKIPWVQHPKRMLLIRARTFPLRDGFADALGGIAIREELEDTFGPDEKKVELVTLTDEGAVEPPPMEKTHD